MATEDTTTPSPSPANFPWRLGLFIALGVCGGFLAGSIVSQRIMAMNPGLAEAATGERLALLAVLMMLYGVLGLAAGVILALIRYTVLHLVRKVPTTSTGWPRWGRRSLAVMALAILGFSLTTLVAGRRSASETTELPPLPAKPAQEPHPVVLLLIDGADLDDMILPMIEAGELPNFQRLMEGGTWGPLKSRRPTLSPILWTSIATGRPARDHGVREFVYFRFPGVDRPIDRMPRASGLRHYLFPLLEKNPALGFGRAPYTSDLRGVRALWEIVADYWPVGVYRWLITWPAEAVEGFMVSGGVYAGPGGWNPKTENWRESLEQETPGALDALGRHPPDLELAPPSPMLGSLADYYPPGANVAGRHSGLDLIRRSLRDPTVIELPELMKRFQPKFTAAAFYSVDSFQHLFTEDRQKGDLFAGAIEERYRFTDRMLGRFMKTLEPRTNLIVISDHGYDFELNHHWEAPAGVFFARGPVFVPGRYVDGLKLADIAPLCLYLLGLPVAEDMPATRAQGWLEAVRPRYAKRHPPSTIPTWERGPRDRQAVDAEVDEELKKSLEALGYL